MGDGSDKLIAGMGQCSWDTLFFVERYPGADEKAEASGLREQGGGPVATALCALVRLGVGCRFAGVVGSDLAGEAIIKGLEAEGVDTSAVIRRLDSGSQRAFIAVERASSKRTIFWQRPTGAPPESGEVPGGFLDGVDLLMLDGLMHEASIALARKAGAIGIPTLLDAGRMREGMRELSGICTHVVGSEVFARQMGIDTLSPQASLGHVLEMFPMGLTITLGERGAVHYGEGGVLSVPAFKVECVDTTGAGDVFHAGYAYGLLMGFDIRSTLRFASAMAALSTRALGGRAALPSLSDIMSLMGREGF